VAAPAPGPWESESMPDPGCVPDSSRTPPSENYRGVSFKARAKLSRNQQYSDTKLPILSAFGTIINTILSRVKVNSAKVSESDLPAQPLIDAVDGLRQKVQELSDLCDELQEEIEKAHERISELEDRLASEVSALEQMVDRGGSAYPEDYLPPRNWWDLVVGR